MATTTVKKKVQVKLGAGKPAAPVLDSAHDAWLAGLGLLSAAREEGGKLLGQGSRMFERFVSEGTRFEKESRGRVDETLGSLRNGLESTVETVRGRAADQLGQIETTVEEGLAGLMNRLGLATAIDVERVSSGVQKMSGQVSENWKKLDALVETRVNALLDGFDLPVAGELKAVSGRVHEVSREMADKVGRLEKQFEERFTTALAQLDQDQKAESRRIADRIQEATESLGGRWDRFESEFETRVSETLVKLGIPTKEEFNKLSDGVGQLSRQIRALQAATQTPVKKVPAKTAPGKPRGRRP